MKIDLYDYYQSVKQNDIILSFKGALSQEILVEIGSIIRSKFAIDKSLKKIFAVFIELAQNIMHYSAEKEFSPIEEKEIGVGIIVFSENKDFYYLGSGNAVKNDKVKALTDRIDKVNLMTSEELKEYYQEQRRKPQAEGSKGAGLGFIDIARKSGHKIEYTTNEIDSESQFLVLHVKFNKG